MIQMENGTAYQFHGIDPAPMYRILVRGSVLFLVILVLSFYYWKKQGLSTIRFVGMAGGYLGLFLLVFSIFTGPIYNSMHTFKLLSALGFLLIIGSVFAEFLERTEKGFRLTNPVYSISAIIVFISAIVLLWPERFPWLTRIVENIMTVLSKE